MPPVAAPHVLPEEVSQYCAAHQLTPYLETALRLAEEAFAPVKRLKTTLETDPETGEEYLVIEVVMADRGDRVLDQKKRYTRAWVQAAPHDIRRRIRLAYDFI